MKTSELIALRKPFKGNHIFAEWRGTMYAVYSYGYDFPLFAYDSINSKSSTSLYYHASVAKEDEGRDAK